MIEPLPLPWPSGIPDSLAADADAAAELLGVSQRPTLADIDADEGQIAPGYGLPSAAGQEALHALARTEAAPTRSTPPRRSRVWSPMRGGRYPAGAAVVFIHTDGVPAIFADLVALNGGSLG